MHCDPAQTTLRHVVEGILGSGDGHGTGPRDVSVYEATRLLADPDFEDNFDQTLAYLNCGRGKFVTIVDEDSRYGTINVAICLLPYVSVSRFGALLTHEATVVVLPTHRRPTPRSSSFRTHFPFLRSNRDPRPQLGSQKSGRRGKTTTTTTTVGSSHLLNLPRHRRNSRGQQMGTNRRSLRITRHPR